MCPPSKNQFPKISVNGTFGFGQSFPGIVRGVGWWNKLLAIPVERVFDCGMAAIDHRVVMQMQLTPQEVGKALGLYVAARCNRKLPNGAKVRVDYYFDRVGKSFAGAKARVEAL